MNDISSVLQLTTFWDDYKKMIHFVSINRPKFDSELVGEEKSVDSSSISDNKSEHSLSQRSEESVYPVTSGWDTTDGASFLSLDMLLSSISEIQSEYSLGISQHSEDRASSDSLDPSDEGSCGGGASKHSDDSLYRLYHPNKSE